MTFLGKIRKYLFGSKLERSIKGKETWFDQLLDWFYDKYTDLIILPFETTCRFFYWGWKLRHNYEFVCKGLTYYMIHLKLKTMVEYSRKHAHCCWNSQENGKEFRKLKIACELAKRLWEDDYNVNMNLHNHKWGKNNMTFREDHRIVFWRKNAWNPELQEKEHKEYWIASKTDTQQRNNEKKYLFYLMDKYLDTWWD